MLIQQHFSRFWMLGRLFKVSLSGVFFVYFCDLLVADICTSAHVLFYDTEFVICFYISGDYDSNQHFCHTLDPYVQPVLAFFPYFWRFCQCFRTLVSVGDRWQIINMGKYFTASMVTVATLMEVFYPTIGFYAWTVLYVSATLYQYSWDVMRDWKLHPYYLRDELH